MSAKHFSVQILLRARMRMSLNPRSEKFHPEKTILHGFDKTRLLYFTFEGYTMSVQRKKYKRKIPITEKGAIAAADQGGDQAGI